jgi:hypothetical protein
MSRTREGRPLAPLQPQPSPFQANLERELAAMRKFPPPDIEPVPEPAPNRVGARLGRRDVQGRLAAIEEATKRDREIIQELGGQITEALTRLGMMSCDIAQLDVATRKLAAMEDAVRARALRSSLFPWPVRNLVRWLDRLH